MRHLSLLLVQRTPRPVEVQGMGGGGGSRTGKELADRVKTRSLTVAAETR